MNNNYEINKLRVQQFGLTATIKDDDGKEHYFYRGHEYIEIGGVKWAVTNVGAEKETNSGLYFAFGEAQGYTAEQVRSRQKFFNWASYKYGNGTNSPGDIGITKYNKTDHKTILEACDDSVKAYWGGKWRMPTVYEFESLLYSTTSEWVENYEGSGANGRLFTDKTDSSKKLFFLAAGFCFYDSTSNVGSYGFYWTSSLFDYSVTSGRSFSFNDGFFIIAPNVRYDGFPIRGVVGK